MLIPSDKPHGVATGSSTGPRHSLVAIHRFQHGRGGEATLRRSLQHYARLALPAVSGQRRDGDRLTSTAITCRSATATPVSCGLLPMPAPACFHRRRSDHTAQRNSTFARSIRFAAVAGGDGPPWREGHRNGGGGVVDGRGILAYLDRYGYDYVTDVCQYQSKKRRAAGRVGCATSSSTGTPRRRAAPGVPLPAGGTEVLDHLRHGQQFPLMRGYLRLGARACGGAGARPGLWRGRLLPGLLIRTTPIRDICDGCDRLQAASKW